MNKHLSYVIYRDTLCLYYSKNSAAFRYNLGFNFSHLNKVEIKKIKNLLKKRILPDELEENNDEIQKEVKKVSNLIQSFQLSYGKPPSIPELKQLLKLKTEEVVEISDSSVLSPIALLVDTYNTFLDEKRKKFSDKPESLKDYVSFRNSLIDYEKYYHIKLLNNSFNKATLNQYFEFLQAGRPKNEGYITLGKLDGKTIKKRFDILKQFYRWINSKLEDTFKKELFILTQAISEIDLVKITKKVARIKLTPQQIHLIQDFYLSPETPEYKARDMFLVALYTGMRISDLITLNQDHIQTIREDNETYYFVVREAVKTKGKYTVQLDDYVVNILSKYGYNMKLMSPQKANLYLKKLLSKIPEFQSETGHTKIGQNNKVRKLKLYEIITFHQARRTFITTMLDKGFTISEAMERTDHKKVSTFEKYVSEESKLKIKKLNLYS
jgi:integrase